LQLVLDWVLINGGLCALGTLIAFGHPFTVIGAFLAAPLTSLNPTIGAGMVTAAIETYMRKPTVEDFSNLRSDTTHLKGWWGNRVTRVLLVFILSTLGSAAGTYLAGFRIFERLTGS
jgi:pheromone shutdown protein TraB